MADITPRRGSPTQFALFRILISAQFIYGFATGRYADPTWYRALGVILAMFCLLGWHRRMAAMGILGWLSLGVFLLEQQVWAFTAFTLGLAFLLWLVPNGEPFAKDQSRGAEWDATVVASTVAEVFFFAGGWFSAYLMYRDQIPDLVFEDGFFWQLMTLGIFALDARWIHPQFSNGPAVVYFDGVCGLCNRFVDWLFAEDANEIFKVSALQSDYAAQHLDPKWTGKSGGETVDPTSLIFTDASGTYHRSTAVLRIVSRLGGVLRWARLFEVIPLFIRDGIYDFIAGNRYQWFGKRETCRLPSKKERDRFLQ